MADIKQLCAQRYKYLVVDEGHRLKNFNCRLIRELRTLPAENRLLLTGGWVGWGGIGLERGLPLPAVVLALDKLWLGCQNVHLYPLNQRLAPTHHLFICTTHHKMPPRAPH